jgi:hypothetical protein
MELRNEFAKIFFEESVIQGYQMVEFETFQSTQQ